MNPIIFLFGAFIWWEGKCNKTKRIFFKPSDADYRVTKDLVVESIEGNPLDLLNSTLYQDSQHFGDHYCLDAAYAPISGVEKISIGSSDYYKLI